jgi:hypothetical protein
VELFCARFRQEDSFRDLKQRLGWEECRAWTKNPIVRTTLTLFVTLTALRLLQFRLQEEVGDEWWLHPPWNERASANTSRTQKCAHADKCQYIPNRAISPGSRGWAADSPPRGSAADWSAPCVAG